MNQQILITGCDSRYFLMACMLLQLVRKWARDAHLFVLDFGLTNQQCSFLASQNALIRTPSISFRPHHAVKTMLAPFLDQLENWRTAVWLDSDMIVQRDLWQTLRIVMDEMEAEAVDVAACIDAIGTIKGVIDDPNIYVRPFANAVQAANLSPNLPYYNSGFVIYRSPAFLHNMFELGSTMELHSSFDQNVFNLLVHRPDTKIMPLPARIWNVHGRFLDETDNNEAIILHPTSYAQSRHITTTCRVGGTEYEIKFFRHSPWQQYQYKTLTDFLSEHAEALHAAGIAPIKPEWQISRNGPCPCGSGKRYKHCHGSY
jgi:lipopolysaccharide biosynthesis glycosyltransferase